MNLSAIYHRTSDQYSYPVDAKTLQISLQTGVDVKSVQIVYGDPFSGGILGGDWHWSGKLVPVQEKKQLPHHLWWSVQLYPPFMRVKYYFILTFETGGQICYLEQGFLSLQEVEHTTDQLQMFIHPWLHPVDVNQPPAWVANTVWYQIFPDRFARGGEEADPQICPWQHGAVRNDQQYGGDLQGIIDKLPYIHWLGCNGIYLTPIFHAHAIHKYDTIDYYHVDRMFGDRDILRKLVKTAHQHDIKVMLDGVFNHTGTGFFAWQDILKHGRQSRYFDWYMISEYPFSTTGAARKGEYYTFAFADKMPKLNTSNPEVIAYLLDVCSYWVDEFEIDAIRLDVANEVSHEFHKQLRRRIKQQNPDIYLLGENWHDSMDWLRGDQLDAVMNYPLAISLTKFWTDHSHTVKHLEQTLNQLSTRYMKQTNQVLFNLLDSHDTMRLIEKLDHSADAFYQVLMMLLMLPGTPCIYYGTEVQLKGKHDPDCRRCMPWQEIEQGKHEQSLELIRQMIHLRRTHQWMADQAYDFVLHDQERVIDMIKKAPKTGQLYHLVINASQHEYAYQAEKPLLTYHCTLEPHETVQPGGFALFSE